MSSELSVRAFNQILAFQKRGHSPWRTADDERSHELRVLHLDQEAQITHRYLKRRLVLQKSLKGEDVQHIFAHGIPLVFEGKDYPRRLLPKIVEAFQALTKEPSFLDVCVVMSKKQAWPWFNDFADTIDHPTEIWPQAYDDNLPCGACMTADTSINRFASPHPPWTGDSWESDDDCWDKPWTPVDSEVSYAVEKFHVPSKYFGKQLDVELYFAVKDSGNRKGGDVPVRPSTAPEEKKLGLLKVAVRLINGVCKGSTQAVARKSKSILLIPDFALEVYGFVDRVDAGASLVANRGLNEQIIKLRQMLAVHHLMCEFKKEKEGSYTFKRRSSAHYWLVLHYFRRDLPYSDVRRFKIPSTAGSEMTAVCALIMRYLSNSHVEDFMAPTNEFCFSVKMLAALVDRNFSLGRLRLHILDEPLTDYFSLDAVFRNGMRLGALNLCIHDDSLQGLIKTTDFLRTSVVQRLTELNLTLVDPESSTGRQRAALSAPLWTEGIHLLRKCAFFRVDWECALPGKGWDLCAQRMSSAHSVLGLESIALKLVHTCEKFERGEISETVEHFVFRFPPRVTFPINEDNKVASGIVVEAGDPSAYRSYTWDVYRFRNTATDEWLTACVGLHSLYERYHCSVLHIAKGLAYPDASYAPAN